MLSGLNLPIRYLPDMNYYVVFDPISRNSEYHIFDVERNEEISLEDVADAKSYNYICLKVSEYVEKVKNYNLKYDKTMYLNSPTGTIDSLQYSPKSKTTPISQDSVIKICGITEHEAVEIVEKTKAFIDYRDEEIEPKEKKKSVASNVNIESRTTNNSFRITLKENNEAETDLKFWLTITLFIASVLLSFIIYYAFLVC